RGNQHHHGFRHAHSPGPQLFWYGSFNARDLFQSQQGNRVFPEEFQPAQLQRSDYPDLFQRRGRFHPSNLVRVGRREPERNAIRRYLMKKLAICALLLCGLFTCGVVAQQAANVDRPTEPNFLFDDDGGKVQIVPADFSIAGPKTFHGGAVLTSARQVSIFLGAGWAGQQTRQRQTSLLDVGASNANPHIAELQKHNIKMLRSAPLVEDFSDLSKTRVNDLTIQQRLSDLLQSKAIPAPGASTVYVVFLAPGIDSTLGGNKAGLDYAAYHNFVNLEAGEVHYVLVPFHQDARQHAAAATRAFAETALNPNGKGWV